MPQRRSGYSAWIWTLAALNGVAATVLHLALSGAVLGGAVGAQGSSIAGMSIQQQFNIFYAQCMYAHGNQVPGFAPNMYAIPPYPGAGGPPPGGPPPGPPGPPPPGIYPSPRY